jgi:uncharacterized protein YcbX
MRVASLNIYPVKSLRGLSLTTSGVDALGLAGDRRFLVTTPEGQFLTQRTLPQMALIETFLLPDFLTLSAAGHGEIRVSRFTLQSGDAHTLAVNVWKTTGLLADDCGDEVAAWLSDFLHMPVRLVHIGEKFRRPVSKNENDTVSFADGYPLLILSQASVDDLNARIVERGGEPMPIDRFRANIIVSGSAAFAEDTWTRVRIDDVIFRAAGPCARCIMTTTDQQTGKRGHEPLKTLAAYRRDAIKPSDVNFGQNYINETKTGLVKLGDEVVPI